MLQPTASVEAANRVTRKKISVLKCRLYITKTRDRYINLIILSFEVFDEEPLPSLVLFSLSAIAVSPSYVEHFC